MRIPVQAASHQYEVVIGNGLLKEAIESYKALFNKADKIIVLTDEHVWAAQENTLSLLVRMLFMYTSCQQVKLVKSFDNILMQHTHFYWRKNVQENRS